MLLTTISWGLGTPFHHPSLGLGETPLMPGLYTKPPYVSLHPPSWPSKNSCLKRLLQALTREEMARMKLFRASPIWLTLNKNFTGFPAWHGVLADGYPGSLPTISAGEVISKHFQAIHIFKRTDEFTDPEIFRGREGNLQLRDLDRWHLVYRGIKRASPDHKNKTNSPAEVVAFCGGKRRYF